MASIIKLKTHEALTESDGSRRVTYSYTTDQGDTVSFMRLEPATVDVAAKAVHMETQILQNLAEQERQKIHNLAINHGINPCNLTAEFYKYNDKNTLLTDLYRNKEQPQEASVISSLTTLQNVGTKIKLFLGLV